MSCVFVVQHLKTVQLKKKNPYRNSDKTKHCLEIVHAVSPYHKFHFETSTNIFAALLTVMLTPILNIYQTYDLAGKNPTSRNIYIT